MNPPQLARRGLNIVLISRNLSKLEHEAKEIGDHPRAALAGRSGLDGGVVKGGGGAGRGVLGGRGLQLYLGPGKDEVGLGQRWDGFQLRAWLPLPLFPERLHGRVTRVIQADFTGGLEIYEAIKAGLKDLEIGVLGMCPCLLEGAMPSNALLFTLTGILLWSPSVCSCRVSLGLLK